MKAPGTTDEYIKKLELELIDLRQELQVLRDRIDDLGKYHDLFGPIKMKWEDLDKKVCDKLCDFAKNDPVTTIAIDIFQV